MSVRDLGEIEIIRRIRRRVGESRLPGVITGIGDDAAVLALAKGASLLATTDLLIEDVHFRRAWASPADIGWKSVAVNLSDIAAMGGTPRYALVALAVPVEADAQDVEAFYEGAREAAAPHGVAIVGGDTSTSPGGWFVNVTVLGEHTGLPRLRSAARAGDLVAVTGALGLAAAGLAALRRGREAARGAGVPVEAVDEAVRAHLRPSARVAEGQWLGWASGVHAMMDCSDGIATDLAHICRESGVGARVEMARLPVAPAARQIASALGDDAARWAAAGGEDYELLLTCEPGAAARLARGLTDATGTILTVIGATHALGGGVVFVDGRGQPVAMSGGYEHFVG